MQILIGEMLMNRVLFVLLVALAFVATSARAQDTQTNQIERSLTVEQADVVMRVDGLACPFCAHGLEKKLKALDATAEVDIRLNEGLVLVSLKPEQTFTDEVLTKAVKDAGFVVREIKRRQRSGRAS